MRKLLFAFIVTLYACQNIAQDTGKLKLIDTKEAKVILQETPNIQILDVRTPEEFSNGHIESAVNLNFFDQAFISNLEGLDKGLPVFVYCAKGGRSAKAASILIKEGFTQVYDLEGGYGAWLKY